MGGTFPAFLGFQLALSLYQEMEHSGAGSNAPSPVGAPRRQELIDRLCFQGTLYLGDRTYIASISHITYHSSHMFRANPRR